MAAIGHPVCGDPQYGTGEYGLERQFLHAARLAFPHPVTGAEVDVRSELPDDHWRGRWSWPRPVSVRLALAGAPVDHGCAERVGAGRAGVHDGLKLWGTRFRGPLWEVDPKRSRATCPADR